MKIELPDPALVPFVIAATGHRDLRAADLDLLRAEVRVVFEGMRKRMPNTPLVLLSGLAEGADQLVAEVALHHGVYLAFAQPMPIDTYRGQMGAEAAKKFDHLRSLCVCNIALPLGERTPEGIRASEAERSWCYEMLARFLAEHGQVLIALWDGRVSHKRGGTSSVVHHVRSGTLSERAEAGEARCGVVYQVVTPRERDSESERRIRTVRLDCESRRVVPKDGTHSSGQSDLERKTFAQVEANLERFNRESLKQAKKEGIQSSRLIDDATLRLSSIPSRLEVLFAQADAISLRANRWRRRVLSVILLTAVAGTLFYGIQGEVLKPNVLLWLSFPGFVLVAVLFHVWARKLYVEERYLDLRALAEALRVQFFWQLAGITEPVDQHYLVEQRTELDWIRFALRNIWLLHLGLEDDAEIPKPNLPVVLEQWVKSQAAWYGAKARAQSHSVRRREKVSQYALLTAVVWSVIVPASVLIHGPWLKLYPWSELGSGGLMYPVFHVALAVPALLAGAYRLWIEQAGYEEQSREYRYMERQFAVKAKELQENLDSPVVATKLLVELGTEALKENGRWLLLHRERPIEVLSSP